MTTFYIIIIIILALSAGVFAVLWTSKRSEVASLQQLNDQNLRSRSELEEQLRTLLSEKVAAQTRLEELMRKNENEKQEREQSEQRLREQFKNLANDIFSEQSRTFRQTNQESVETLLKPFKDNIVEFRERVEKIYSSENEQHGALKNELRRIIELNQQVSIDTTNLTNALKGNSKVQGDWGEMILETILDNSNLIRGVHYDTQHNIKDESGNNLRPDVVLYLPDKKQIVIDSKVSLTAFTNYVGAETDAERKTLLAAHTASVRQHVRELANKEYQRLLDSPDFVIMFIPNEPAFLAALQNDSSIWAEAYEKSVIISSPTNLFALLKLVDNLWKREAQSRNADDIAKCSVKIYEQMVAFTSSLEGVGASLAKARESYDDAYKRLLTGNDNVARVGERLVKLRLPTKKRLAQQTLDAAELDADE